MPGQIDESLVQQRQEFLDFLALHVRYSPHTRVAYARDTQRLIDFLATDAPAVSHPSDITGQHLMRFAASLSHYAPSTVCRVLDALSSWFNHLSDIGVVADNPVADVPRPRRDQKLPTAATPDGCRALMTAAHTPLERAILGCLIYLGLRRSELLGLNVADFAPDLRTVRVRGKGAKERDLPVPRPLQRLLRAYLQERISDADALLLNRAGRRLGSTSLQRTWKRLLNRADLDQTDLTIHSMRHGAATQWLRAGADVRTVQRLLGHEGLETTARYLHSDDQTMRDAVDRLPDYVAAEGGEGNVGADTGGPCG